MGGALAIEPQVHAGFLLRRVGRNGHGICFEACFAALQGIGFCIPRAALSLKNEGGCGEMRSRGWKCNGPAVFAGPPVDCLELAEG